MSDFKMPAVEIGEVVLWYPDGQANDEPATAIVTAIGEYTLCLSVLAKDAYSLQPEDGVRHIKDPGLKVQENRSRGAWDFGPQRKAVEWLKGQLNELRSAKKGP